MIKKKHYIFIVHGIALYQFSWLGRFLHREAFVGSSFSDPFASSLLPFNNATNQFENKVTRGKQREYGGDNYYNQSRRFHQNQYEYISASTFFNDENSCNTSLHQMVIAMGKHSTPYMSPSWKKNKRILSQAKYYHIGNHPHLIFQDTTKNIINILNGYGLVRLHNETIDSDSAPLNETILIGYSNYDHGEIPQYCTGSRCASIPRISLQAEQLKFMRWAPRFVSACHGSPNCVLWDFSSVNYNWAKTFNASESFMIVPFLFHDRLESMYPRGDDDLLPYQNRSLDAAFFGLITKRRKVFQEKYMLGDNNKTLSSYKIEFRKLNHLQKQADAYKRAKICLVLHKLGSDSAGEFHRLSDFKRFGCVPVMENFSDSLTMNTLKICAGIVFADYDNIAKAIVSELSTMTGDPLVRRRQLAIDRWWRKGIDWASFLHTILGPRIS